MAEPADAAPAGEQGDDEGRLFAGYASPQERPPLASFAALAGLFAGGLTAFMLARRQTGAGLPEEIGSKDLLLIGAGTHKLTRLIAKDKVTSFVRAPFRRYEEKGGPGELKEQPRGSGMRAAVGELIGCPYCLGPWVAGAMMAGLTVAPRETRFVSSTLSALTIADFMQIAYVFGQDQL